MAGIKDLPEAIRLVLSEGRKGLMLGSITALGVGGAFALLHMRGRDDMLAITPGQMPTCDSTVTRHGLLSTIMNAPRAKMIGLAVQRIDVVSELASDPSTAPDRRVCLAVVYTNAGRKLVGFTLTWVSQAKSEVYLELPYGID